MDWLNPLVILGCAVLGPLVIAVATWWLARRVAHRTEGLHWTMRARLGFPLAQAARFNLIFVPLLFAVGAGSRVDSPGGGSPNIVAALVAFLASSAGVIFGLAPLRETPVPFLVWLRSFLFVITVVAPHLVLALIMSLLLPSELGPLAGLGLALAALVFVLAILGGGIELGRLAGVVQPAPARLAAIVRQVAEKAGRPSPTAFVVGWRPANALAFPFRKSIAFTERALEVLSDEELAAVCAHELGHLYEPLPALALRGLAPMTLLPLLAGGAIVRETGWAGLLGVLLTVLLAMLGLRLFSVRLERRADAEARKQSYEGTYARALEKIYRANLAPAVMRANLASHPSLYDRMLDAGVQPDYPRPPPPKRSYLNWLSVAVVVLLLWAAQGVTSCVASLPSTQAQSQRSSR